MNIITTVINTYLFSIISGKYFFIFFLFLLIGLTISFFITTFCLCVLFIGLLTLKIFFITIFFLGFLFNGLFLLNIASP